MYLTLGTNILFLTMFLLYSTLNLILLNINCDIITWRLIFLLLCDKHKNWNLVLGKIYFFIHT